MYHRFHGMRLQIKHSGRLSPRAVLALDCCPERGCHEVTGVEKSEIPFDRTFGTCAEIKSPPPEEDLGMG